MKLPYTKKGFTLVELLVVMAILGVLVTMVASGFRSSQMRGRDAQRKSDLKGMANALEIFYSDYGKYPPSDASGSMLACPYSVASPAACSWGISELTDSKTTYFKVIPKDPDKNQSYYYRIVDAPANQKFQLFARLENTQDKDCLGGNCEASPVNYTCGRDKCNFAVTSANTTATE